MLTTEIDNNASPRRRRQWPIHHSQTSSKVTLTHNASQASKSFVVLPLIITFWVPPSSQRLFLFPSQSSHILSTLCVHWLLRGPYMASKKKKKSLVFWFHRILSIFKWKTVSTTERKIKVIVTLTIQTLFLAFLSRGRPIIGADIKHFTDYRYRPFSKHICR